jgi:S-adenosyl-L-methionine hydrolase (adenosine-forming)
LTRRSIVDKVRAMSFASVPSGVITITTDFGHKGPFVGVMKGVILSRHPQARLIDLTHEIVVHWPAEAGFWLSRAHGYFPSGTVHVAVVDPGVGTSREIVVVTAGGHAFLAPDNGLLAPLAGRTADARIIRVEASALARIGIHNVSATFHGRDIFAPLAAELAAGRLRPEELGEVVDTLVPSWVEEPTVTAHAVAGVVISIDHFGNLITNIEAGLLKHFAAPQVHSGNHVFRLERTYADSRPGEYLALVNSFGVVEIACAEGSAASGLGLGRGAPVSVREAAPHQP